MLPNHFLITRRHHEAGCTKQSISPVRPLILLPRFSSVSKTRRVHEFHTIIISNLHSQIERTSEMVTVPVPISPDERSLLVKYPNEIRHLIYRYIISIVQDLNFLLISDEDDHFIAVQANDFPSFIASILETCRLLNDECTELLFKNNLVTLEIDSKMEIQSACFRLFQCSTDGSAKSGDVTSRLLCIWTRKAHQRRSLRLGKGRLWLVRSYIEWVGFCTPHISTVFVSPIALMPDDRGV